MKKTFLFLLTSLLFLQIIPTDIVAQEATSTSVSEESSINLNDEATTETTSEISMENPEMIDEEQEDLQVRATTFKGNLITDVILTRDGIKEYNTTTLRPQQGDVVQLNLKLNWSRNVTIPKGTYSYTIPNDIKIMTAQSGNLLDGVSYTIGTDNILKVTFNQDATNSNNEIKINTAFKDYPDTDSVNKRINFLLADGTTKSYDLSFVPRSGVKDEITAQADTMINPSIITITQAVNSKNLVVLPEALISFTYGISPNNLSFFAVASVENFKVLQQDQAMGGQTLKENVLVEGIDYEFTVIDNNPQIKLLKPLYHKLNITFDIKIKNEFIKDERINSLAAYASLNSKSIGYLWYTIPHSPFERIIQAGQYRNEFNEVSWKVTYNKSGEYLRRGTILTDVIVDSNSGLTNKRISSITKYSFINGEWVTMGVGSGIQDWDTSQLSTQGKLTYIGEDGNFAYEIVYMYYENGTEEREVSHSVSDGQKKVETKMYINPAKGKKSVLYETLDIPNETVNWKILINEKHIKQSMYKIEDVFSIKVLDVVENSLSMTYKEVSNAESKLMVEGTDYILTKTAKGFDIELQGRFRNTQTYAYEIEYQTKLDLEDYLAHPYSISNGFSGYGPHGKIMQGNAGFNIDAGLFDGGMKQGATNLYYQNEKIDWTVLANNNHLNYQTMVLEDEIDSGYSLIKESLQFYELKKLYPESLEVGNRIVEGDSRYPTNIILEDNKIYLEFDNIGTQNVVVKYSTRTLYYLPRYHRTENVAKIKEKDGSKQPVEFRASVSHTVLDRGISSSNKADEKDQRLVHWEVLTHPHIYDNSQVKYEHLIFENYYVATVGDLDKTNILKTSFVIKDEDGAIIPNSKYTITYDFDKENTMWSKEDSEEIRENNYFKIEFHEPIRFASVSYDTYSTQITAITSRTINSVVKEKSIRLHETTYMTVKDTTSTGEGAVIGDIPIHKIDNVQNKSLEGAIFELFNETTGEAFNYKVTTDSNGKAMFKDLNAGNYIVKEIQAPDGYMISQELQDGVVLTTKSESQESQSDYYYELVNLPESVNVTGTITWNDNDNQDGIRPSEITVNLLANGVKVADTEVTAMNNWKIAFLNVPRLDEGIEIVYTISEDAVSGYTTATTGYDIINTHIPELIDISGSKIWDDNNNQDGIRPDNITVNLLANGVKIADKVVTDADSWSYDFVNLPKFEAGTEILYTITEEEVLGYTTTNAGYDLINTYLPETFEIVGKISWNDNNNQDGMRPSNVKIHLYKIEPNDPRLKIVTSDSTLTQETITTDDFGFKFVNVPKYQNGIELVYTVSQEEIANYITEIDDSDLNNIIITNTYVPTETEDTLVQTGETSLMNIGVVTLLLSSLLLLVTKRRKV